MMSRASLVSSSSAKTAAGGGAPPPPSQRDDENALWNALSSRDENHDDAFVRIKS